MEEVACRSENVFQFKKKFGFLLEGCIYCEKSDMRIQKILGKLGLLVFYFKKVFRACKCSQLLLANMSPSFSAIMSLFEKMLLFLSHDGRSSPL